MSLMAPEFMKKGDSKILSAPNMALWAALSAKNIQSIYFALINIVQISLSSSCWSISPATLAAAADAVNDVTAAGVEAAAGEANAGDAAAQEEKHNDG